MPLTTSPAASRPGYHSSGTWARSLFALIILVGLAAVGFINFLLFHTVVELTTILISLLTFAVVVGTYRLTCNNYLLILGCGAFWTALFDLGHTLAYHGMGFAAFSDANRATQLWLCGRSIETFAMILAPVIARNRASVRVAAVFAGFGWLALALGMSILLDLFPVAYLPASGLTRFKVVFEYALVGGLLLAGYLTWYQRSFLPSYLWGLMLTAIALTIMTEFIFTAYLTLTGPLNILGHLTKVLAFWLIFEAVIGPMLLQPFGSIARTIMTFDGIPDPVLLVSQDGTIVQVNDAAAAWFDSPARDLIGKSLREILVPSSPAAPALSGPAEAALFRALKAFTPLSGHRMTDSQNRACLLSMSILTSGDPGKANGVMLVYLRDITAWEQAQNDLQTARFQLGCVLENSGYGIWDWTVSNGEVRFSPEMETMLGYAVGDWGGSVRSWEKRIHSEDRSAVMSDLQAHLEGRTPFYDNVHRIQHKDGHWVWIHDQGRVVERDGVGRPLRAIGTHCLYTPPVAMTEGAPSAGGAVTEHLATLARETVQEPLRAASQFLALIVHRHLPSLEGDCRELLIQAQANAKRAFQSLESLTAFCASDGEVLPSQAVALEKGLQTVSPLLQPRHQVTPWLKVQGPLPVVAMAPAMLEGVLLASLLALQNAYSPDQTQQITVQGWTRDKHVVLEVCAEQGALTLEQREALLSPAHPLPVVGHAGNPVRMMTLAMAQRAVERVGGGLTLIGEGRGQRVAIRLVLPAALSA